MINKNIFFALILFVCSTFAQLGVLYNTAFWDFTTLDTYDTAVITATKNNPTLASGDVKISIDGGTIANLDTLPDVYPANGNQVRLRFKSANIVGKRILVYFHDQTSPPEWCDKTLTYYTYGNDTAFVTYYPADIKKVVAGTTAASNLSKFTINIKTFTIDTAAFTPTRSVFETTLTNADKGWYKGRYIIFESTATNVAYQKGLITDYRVVSGRGRITVSGLTAVPLHGYAAIIIP